MVQGLAQILSVGFEQETPRACSDFPESAKASVSQLFLGLWRGLEQVRVLGEGWGHLRNPCAPGPV